MLLKQSKVPLNYLVYLLPTSTPNHVQANSNGYTKIIHEHPESPPAKTFVINIELLDF